MKQLCDRWVTQLWNKCSVCSHLVMQLILVVASCKEWLFVLFIFRNISGSDEKPGPDQSPFEAPSQTDGPSPHDQSLHEISGTSDDPYQKEALSPGDSTVGMMKLSQSYCFGDSSSKNGDVGGESDKNVTREMSPTRWCAVTAWQRRQQQQQQQGTPGHRSEVSSIVESAVDTEDGEFFFSLWDFVH